MVDINLLIGISLLALAFIMFCVLLVLIPIAWQLFRTLNAAQSLIETINEDLKPTAIEIKQSINELKRVFNKCTSPITKVIDKVKVPIVSSYHGIVSAVKNYLSNYNNNGGDEREKNE